MWQQVNIKNINIFEIDDFILYKNSNILIINLHNMIKIYNLFGTIQKVYKNK